MSFTWNPENTETLKAMRGEGKSYGLIAAQLGTSRNSAIAKGNRIGIERTGPNPQVRMQRKPEDKPRAPRPRSAFIPWVNKPKCEAVEAAPAPPPAPETIIPVGKRCTILELTKTTCRWPMGDPSAADFFFCGGKTVEGLPYCGCHSRIAYVGCRGHANPLSRKPLDERAG